MFYQQQIFDVKFEWGREGIEALAGVTDVFIIVDVLSFSTSVDIATSGGALIYPYQWKDESAAVYADSIGAYLAKSKRTNTNGYSLSPSSLVNVPTGTKLVLPSPNGSTLSLATGNVITLCGCIRNAEAVASYAMQMGRRVTVIAAGERWRNGTLRPAFEDLVGAGAIISYLQGSLSPESKTALSAFNQLKHNLLEEMKKCSSGKELIEMGFEKDVELASHLNISNNVPVLKDMTYVGLTTV